MNKGFVCSPVLWRQLIIYALFSSHHRVIKMLPDILKINPMSKIEKWPLFSYTNTLLMIDNVKLAKLTEKSRSILPVEGF